MDNQLKKETQMSSKVSLNMEIQKQRNEMENIKNIVLGFVIGIITTTIGSFLFIKLVLQNDFNQGLQFVKDQGYLGKIITLGAVLNIIVFFINFIYY